MAVIRGFARNRPGGDLLTSGTVEIRALDDNALLGTAPITAGTWEFTFAGNPRPYNVVVVGSGLTAVTTSRVVGMSGPTSVSSIPSMFRAFGNGVISGVLNSLAVASGGTNMNITLATGAALAQGIIFENDTIKTIAVPAAHASLPRIDTLVIEVVPPGAANEGSSTYKLIGGAAAATPVAPTLAQTTTLYQEPLADIRVDAAVSVIASNKVTDRRRYSGSPFTVLNGTESVLATPVSGGIDQPTRLYLASGPFAINSDLAQRRTRVTPVYGTTANTFAEGNHTHPKVLIGSSYRGNQLTGQQSQSVLGAPIVTFDAAAGWNSTRSYLVTMKFDAYLYAGSGDLVNIQLGITGDYVTAFGNHVFGSAGDRTVPAQRTFIIPAGSTSQTFRVQYTQTSGVTLYSPSTLVVTAVPQ